MVWPSVAVEGLFRFRVEVWTAVLPRITCEVENKEDDAENEDPEYSYSTHRRHYNRWVKEDKTMQSRDEDSRTQACPNF